ncbi:MAG TPA: phenylphosphate carboxylase subunit delta [Vicinamibacterales bacterium]|nr:phenylphosphate carboxylase subunit delta [Vicinamibacterales bacterium]HQL31603.1 phenylphosphate carboxylase subunit delta [Thermoanaerobaculales bacterium]
MPSDDTTLQRQAARVRLLLFDVDGVLTDGRILVHPDGTESKSFSIRDGTGIVWAHRAGLRTGLLSGRHSPATAVRAGQLGIPIVRHQRGDKLEVFEGLLRDEGTEAEAVAFMGDDLLDLPVLLRVGLSAAPADADPEVVRRVDWVSRHPGGRGAARELIELVLRAQGKWDGVLEGYLGGTRV